MSEKPLTLALSQRERGLTARDFKSTANQALSEREKGLSACDFKNTANQPLSQRERGIDRARLQEHRQSAPSPSGRGLG
ncbi:hypothetical protein CJU78_01490 [Pseudomonas fragi]|nr:hypothetical protein CJU78_01490 [Pseudomonas fragi]